MNTVIKKVCFVIEIVISFSLIFNYFQDDKSLKENENLSSESKETVSSTDNFINDEGVLFYYRRFVHSLLDEIDNEVLYYKIIKSLLKINKILQHYN